MWDKTTMKRRKAKSSAGKKVRTKRTAKRRKSTPARQTPEAQAAALKRFKAPTADQLNTTRKPDPHYY
jgi:hypothetical protein